MLWVKAGVIFKRPDRRIDLLVETTHALCDVSIGTVSQDAGTLLLGFIGLALEWTTVLKFPDA